MSDIMEIAEIKKIGFLVTMGNFYFEKYGFGENFISCVTILLKDQESCLLNGGTTTKYFQFGRGAHQGDPILASFILALEIVFHLIKSKPEIKGRTMFGHCYPYSAYADDTTFFLDNTISIKSKFDAFFSVLF